MDQAQLMKLLNRAEQYIKSKQYRLAKVDLEQIIKQFPANSKANELIAYLYSNEGNNDLAFRYLGIACKDKNCSPRSLYYLANFYIKKNQIKEAVPLLEASLKKAGDYFEALHDLGVAQTILGDKNSALKNFLKALNLRKNSLELFFNIAKTYDELKNHKLALEFYSKVIALNPTFAQAFSNRGVVFNELNRFDEALIDYDRAFLINPNFYEALTNKSITLKELGRYEEALQTCEKAIQLNENNGLVYCVKGTIFTELKNYSQAKENIQQALNLNPQDSEIWLSSALLHITLHEFDKAASDIDQAILLNPLSDNVWSIKGLLESELTNYQDALIHIEKALQINPLNAQAWANKANICIIVGRHEDALNAFIKAKFLKPKLKYLTGSLALAKLVTAHWEGLENDVLEIVQKQEEGGGAINPFDQFAVVDNPKLHLEVAKSWSRDKHITKVTLPRVASYAHNKIRIGYFSPDFKNHPVSFITAELFEKHDRTKYEVIGFALARAQPDDEMRARLKAGFDQLIDVAGQTEIQIAQLARDLEIDIAIDLGGHTLGAKPAIFYHRAAPIQVNYLGYAGSMGVDYIDYIIADETVIPPKDQKYYSEEVIYLPHCFMPDDSQRQPSDRIFTRTEFGLPEVGFVFCCFNNSYKFNAALINSWSRILLKTPQGVLWISKNNSIFQSNILNEFSKRNISSDRIIFAGRVDLIGDHLARYRLADLFLDTTPYNAHSTALDALKAGVPVLTRIGQSFPARVAASLLNTLQMPDLITHTEEAYEEHAITLANNPDQYQQVKDRLAQHLITSPLFDSQRYIQNLEDLYLNMYQNHVEA